MPVLCVTSPASEPGLHARVSSWRRGKVWCNVLGSEALWSQARRPAARCCPEVFLRFCYREAGSAFVTALDARCVGLVES